MPTSNPLPLEILYRDSNLIAIDKPSGWLVHRSNLDRHETRIIVQHLRDQIGQRVYPIHRLDKGTSGVLLLALNPETCHTLAQQFEHHQICKTYWAIVRGWPTESGVINHPLRDIEDRYGQKPVLHEGREAITEFRRLATVELPFAVDRYPTSRYALLELNPITGRRHQIRRHLKHIAHPIIGDATYGKGSHNRFFQQTFDANRLLLACVSLTFNHPTHNQPCTVSAPVSGAFRSLVERFGEQARELA